MNKPIAPLVHYWINTYYGPPMQAPCDGPFAAYSGEPLDTTDGVTCEGCLEWADRDGAD